MKSFAPQEQIRLLNSIEYILHASGCELKQENNCIWACFGKKKKEVRVYPAMWVEPHGNGIIYVSDAYIKYAKPYAVQKILEEVKA